MRGTTETAKKLWDFQFGTRIAIRYLCQQLLQTDYFSILSERRKLWES